MKRRNEKRISTSFSLSQLEDICCGLSATADDDHGFERWERFNGLREKLRARVAVRELQCSGHTAMGATACEPMADCQRTNGFSWGHE